MTTKYVTLLIAVLTFNLYLSANAVTETEEYCLLESFRPRCLKNEVIFMSSAIFGRMRVGRCITAEEVSGLGPIVGEDPRYLGCSEDVLPSLDQKCTGKTDCEVRVGDIPGGNVKPCFPGLKMYLEVSYACLSIVDEGRSCTVAASKNAVHFIGSLSSSRLCGTKSQPWVIEASIGKRVSLTLLKVIIPPTNQMEEQSRQPCYNYGLIWDKIGRKNVSICGDGLQREKNLYLSSGNTVHIIFNQPTEKDAIDDGRMFILKVEAIGCSDIIPPEDTWLKRNNDVIVIGCYSNRQTWRLSCDEGKWIGVLGNCSSQDTSVIHESFVESKTSKPISGDEQILALVAIVGCTLAVCMAIICIGVVCLRRYHAQGKKKQAYHTLNYEINRARGQTTDPRFLSGTGTDLTGHVVGTEQMPTYSVYVGDEGFQDVSINTNSSARI